MLTTVDSLYNGLRQGITFPHWLLQPGARMARAMVAVIAEAYLAGVSPPASDL